MTWQDEATPEEWDEWQSLAQRLSKSKKQVTSLGPEDYASQFPTWIIWMTS